MSNKKNNNFDEQFKNIFENNKVSPANNMWDKIDTQLDEQLDAVFKNKLSTNEVSPTPNVWKNIEKELPLNLFVRRQLQWLSKVAAILVFVMLTTVLYNYVNFEETPVITEQTQIENPKKEVTLTIDMPKTNEDFVVGIKKKVKKKNSKKKKTAKEDTQVLLDEFFADILSEEEDFETDIDDEMIQQALQPLERLPIEDVVAFLPKKELSVNSSKGFDMEIKIPLIVVEASEVNELLDAYDKKQSEK